MSEINEVINDIDILREKLYRIIVQKNYNLDDPEVLEASECINKAIVAFNFISN